MTKKIISNDRITIMLDIFDIISKNIKNNHLTSLSRMYQRVADSSDIISRNISISSYQSSFDTLIRRC